MPAPAQAERPSTWDLGGFDGVEVDAAGRIVDVIDPSTTRADTPEERVRQEYARVLVEEYGYPRDRIVLGATIHIGREPYYADIVIYGSADAALRRLQGEVTLVVETKKPNLEEGKGQLVSYIFASSAQGGVWSNGEDVAYFRRVELPEPHLQDWTNIPRIGETWDTVGHYNKKDLRPPRDLKRVFQRCHNAIYKAGLDSEDVALDMVRIILAKYRD
jgi:type I restriction enzyme M protein